MPLDLTAAAALLDGVWTRDIEPTLADYIRIPNVSPAFDADWSTHGHMDRAVTLLADWARDRPIAGLTVTRRDLPGRTPVLELRVPAFGDAADAPEVLCYGHLDKQPPMDGWRDGLGPWEPVREGDRLYGRGGADDGYALFATLAAVEAVQASGGSHGPLLVLIEASEESGSSDLPAHLEAMGDALGRPALVVCLDSGAIDYERLWVTTSLRGIVIVHLRVDVLTEGVHSGSAGGVVPSSFRIARQLLDRLEDAATGDLRIDALRVDIPDERVTQAEATAAEIATGTGTSDVAFPYAGGTRPHGTTLAEQLLRRSWHPSLEVVGADGLPATADAGNVLRPTTALLLSLRVPPTVDAHDAADAVVAALTADPPHGAAVSVTVRGAESGWAAPPTAPWLDAALAAASEAAYGRSARAMGEGGTIPFMGMLGRRFPDAQFVITGVLGPGSNAHGPNEFIDLAYARRLTLAVASLLDAAARHDQPSA